MPNITNSIPMPNILSNVSLDFDNMLYNIISEKNNTGRNHNVCQENNSSDILCPTTI